MPLNPFAALAADDEDLAQQEQVVEPKGAKASEEKPKVLKPTQGQASSAAKPAKGGKEPAKTAAPAKDASAAVQKTNQAPRQRSAKPRAPAQAQAPAQGDNALSTENDLGDFEKTHEHGRFRSNRGGRDGYSQRNERQSHQRPSKGEKRDGHGAFNWGATKEVVNDVLEETKKEETPEGAAPSAAPATETAEAPKEEEGPKQVTYEEYKRQLQTRRAASSLPAQRKAGEGEDSSRWGGKELVKAEGEAADAEDKEVSGDRRAQRAFKKQTVSIDVQFAADSASRAEPRDNRSRERGGERGGERGPRGPKGGRNSGGPRPPRSNASGAPAAAAVAFTEADFPSL